MIAVKITQMAFQKEINFLIIIMSRGKIQTLKTRPKIMINYSKK